MFTGIVEEQGHVVALDMATDGGDALLRIDGPLVTGDVAHGHSISVNGVCLTVVGSDGSEFEVDVMGETLQRTAIGALAPGDVVNLERSVTPTSRLGGHIVQGHVDGIGVLSDRRHHEKWDTLIFRVPAELGRYIAGKGAIAIHGISLTVIEVADTTDDDGNAATEFSIGVIPETLRATTLGATQVGDRVNIEVDVMAKYVERLLGAGLGGVTSDTPDISVAIDSDAAGSRS